MAGPLCKRKSPWIIEAVSFRFCQSSVHCGKLISRAEALQEDSSKRDNDCPKPPTLFHLLTSPVAKVWHISCPKWCKIIHFFTVFFFLPQRSRKSKKCNILLKIKTRYYFFTYYYIWIDNKLKIKMIDGWSSLIKNCIFALNHNHKEQKAQLIGI